MCGIAGYISLSDRDDTARRFSTLFSGLAHRGPHGHSEWHSEHQGTQQFHLGHHRLAIVDLDERANQPMTGIGGSKLIVNGEIYNAFKLKAQLENQYNFKTTSDSEVLLAVLDIYGLQGLSRLDGMFAFAYVPADRSSIWLGRDRLGIKPLYWTREGESVWFSSEARPLAKALNRGIDEYAFTEWARYQLQTSSRTFFSGIQSVAPGHVLTIREGQVKSREYWTLDDHLPSAQRIEISVPEAAARLRELFHAAVNSHLMSDVEVATIVSGGIDSSWIGSVAATLGVKAAYVGRYLEEGFDESRYARLVADQVKLSLTTIDIAESDFFENLSLLGKIGDFPVAGPGAVGQLRVAHQVSLNQRVVLAGTGGDELFLGYVRDRFPLMAMSLLEASGGRGSSSWSQVSGDIAGLSGYEPMLRLFANAGGFTAPLTGFLAIIQRSSSINGPFRIDQDICTQVDAELRTFMAPDGADSLDQIHDALLRYEVGKFLPSLLQVEDRVTMAHGLESRVPILDLALIEHVLGLPLAIRLGGERPKDLMRIASQNDLPQEIRDRKDKMGFPVPLNLWARGDSKGRIKDLISSLADRGLPFIDGAALQNIMNSQDLANRNLWAVISLESWLRAND